MLKTCRMVVVTGNKENFIPVMPSNVEPKNTMVSPANALKIIEDKWKINYDQNSKK